jgi:hypothetical protein
VPCVEESTDLSELIVPADQAWLRHDRRHTTGGRKRKGPLSAVWPTAWLISIP